MVELIIVAALVLVPLFLAIPLIAKYLDIRSAAVQTARYAAWERTVWYGGDAATPLGWLGASNRWQANAKTDGQIRNEIGVRQLSETGATAPFTSGDRTASDFKSASKMFWHDARGNGVATANPGFIAAFGDVNNTISSSTAPGTMSKALGPIADLAATLGPFTLEMKGEYGAKVTINVSDYDQDHYYISNSKSKLAFSESNILLANGWSTAGPDDATMTSTKGQVKGLVPFSIFTGKILGVPVVEYIQTAISVFLPEASKLELGKIDPEVVPPDRLK
jgi:hypothetical protein